MHFSALCKPSFSKLKSNDQNNRNANGPAWSLYMVFNSLKPLPSQQENEVGHVTPAYEVTVFSPNEMMCITKESGLAKCRTNAD